MIISFEWLPEDIPTLRSTPEQRLLSRLLYRAIQDFVSDAECIEQHVKRGVIHWFFRDKRGAGEYGSFRHVCANLFSDPDHARMLIQDFIRSDDAASKMRALGSRE